MSKNRKQAKKEISATQPTAKMAEKKPNKGSSQTADLPFGKSNFLFMLIGIGVIFVGFVIMTLDKEEFGFGFLGITLGPIIVFCGFMIELYAILKKKA